MAQSYCTAKPCGRQPIASVRSTERPAARHGWVELHGFNDEAPRPLVDRWLVLRGLKAVWPVIGRFTWCPQKSVTGVESIAKLR